MKGFFPPKPATGNGEAWGQEPVFGQVGRITIEQIHRQLKKIKPYKAPGPDSIPNIVLSKNANVIADRLYHIYVAMLENDLQYRPWKTFVMVVLRKLGKPRYNLPKAYRPIALLNTMWKVLTAIIADHITYASEKHQLLLANHFRGHLRCTMTDAMHLLTHKIKAAMRAGKVTLVLFLDIVR